MLTVQVAAVPSPDLSRAIALTLTDLTSSVLHKDPAVTSVALDYIDPSHWFAGRTSGAPAFFVTARVTAGTNTKDEKAEYVRRVFEALDRLLNGVHPASYVHVEAVSADSYGYGGQTAEFRYVAARTAVAV
jgi:4-oxalocrotonate tautomerase